MDFSVENLEKAVTVFYRAEALDQQAEAHHFLTEAQNSPHAWSFVWDLLDIRRVSKSHFSLSHAIVQLFRSFIEFRSAIFCRHNITHETNEILDRSARRSL